MRWRIQDQLRNRARHPLARNAGVPLHASGSAEDGSRTATVHRIADSAVPEFGREWDLAWEENILQLALEKLRLEIDERQFQIFDLYVMKGWSPSRVAKLLAISVPRVYLAKHRVSILLRRQVKRLQRRLNLAP